MSVRTVLPTDLVALVAFDGRVYPNEAVILDRIGRESPLRPLETAVEQFFSFATGRHTWITVHGATLRGLLSARRRGGRQAWEFDCLIDAADDDPSVLLSLLDRATQDAGRAGADRLFLRLRSASPALEGAQRAGFTVLQEERLYRCDQPQAGRDGHEEPALRHRRRADLYRLFQLYNGVVPDHVRQQEAVTLKEWVAAQERLAGPRRTAQYVLEEDGRLLAWLRIASDAVGRFEILARPDSGVIGGLVGAALARLGDKSALFTLVPAWAEPVARALERRGFAVDEEYVVLVRRTMKPVRTAKLVPAQTMLA